MEYPKTNTNWYVKLDTNWYVLKEYYNHEYVEMLNGEIYLLYSYQKMYEMIENGFATADRFMFASVEQVTHGIDIEEYLKIVMATNF